MEIQFLPKEGLKIKTKEVTFLAPPFGKIDCDVILAFSQKEIPATDKMAFYGPGEYEISGVSIKGIMENGTLLYSISEDTQKILLGRSTASLTDMKDTEGYTAVIVRIDTKATENLLSGVSSEIVVLYGDSCEEGLDPTTIKKTEKINLKKIEELKEFTVILGK